MKSFYFIFENDHPFHNHCQQIVAENMTTAKQQMTVVFGDNWLHCYSQKEFENFIRKGKFSNLQPLPPIYEKHIV
jgi:hypothetical protein